MVNASDYTHRMLALAGVIQPAGRYRSGIHNFGRWLWSCCRIRNEDRALSLNWQQVKYICCKLSLALYSLQFVVVGAKMASFRFLSIVLYFFTSTFNLIPHCGLSTENFSKIIACRVNIGMIQKNVRVNCNTGIIYPLHLNLRGPHEQRIYG